MLLLGSRRRRDLDGRLAGLADGPGDRPGRGGAVERQGGRGRRGRGRRSSRRSPAAFADGRRVAPAGRRRPAWAWPGFDRPEDRRLLGDWSRGRAWADRLVLVNDGDLVVAAGTPEGWGVGVIAGTGSIAVGRAPDGRRPAPGAGATSSATRGAPTAVALAALRLVARRADGREPHP